MIKKKSIKIYFNIFSIFIENNNKLYMTQDAPSKSLK